MLQLYHRMEEKSHITTEGLSSLGNPSKDCQRFVDAFVLIFASDWSNRLSIFENVIEIQFELTFKRKLLLGFARLFLLLVLIADSLKFGLPQ